MDNFDQFIAPDYPIFLGSEFEHPKPEEALFSTYFPFLMKNLFLLMIAFDS
jgi:hypothetical protein